MSHRRLRPVQHEFRYRIFMPLFDLDELPELLDPFPLWSARRPAPAWLRAPTSSATPARRSPSRPRLVADRLGRAPGGAGPAARPPSLPRGRVQPGELPVLLTRARGARRGDRRGHQHALGRAPRLRARRPRAAAAADGRWAGSRQAHARLPVHGHGPDATSGGPRRPGIGSGIGFRNLEDGEAVVRGLARTAAARDQPRS